MHIRGVVDSARGNQDPVKNVEDYPQLRITSGDGVSGPGVRVAGELDASVERQFVDAISDALKTSGGVVDVDLTRVTFIDSGGLRGLIRCLTDAQQVGTSLVLTVTYGPVVRLLAVSGITELFTFSAASSFRPVRTGDRNHFRSPRDT